MTARTKTTCSLKSSTFLHFSPHHPSFHFCSLRSKQVTTLLRNQSNDGIVIESCTVFVQINSSVNTRTVCLDRITTINDGSLRQRGDDVMCNVLLRPSLYVFSKGMRSTAKRVTRATNDCPLLPSSPHHLSSPLEKTTPNIHTHTTDPRWTP